MSCALPLQDFSTTVLNIYQYNYGALLFSVNIAPKIRGSLITAVVLADKVVVTV
jgi:hypothetical protein